MCIEISIKCHFHEIQRYIVKSVVVPKDEKLIGEQATLKHPEAFLCLVMRFAKTANRALLPVLLLY